jgi:hypothetical protein
LFEQVSRSFRCRAKLSRNPPFPTILRRKQPFQAFLRRELNPIQTQKQQSNSKHAPTKKGVGIEEKSQQRQNLEPATTKTKKNKGCESC